MEIFLNLLFIPFILLLNNFLKKNNYLKNYTGEKHQLYTNQKSIYKNLHSFDSQNLKAAIKLIGIKANKVFK